MYLFGIRGAITISANDKNDILTKTRILLSDIISRNSLEKEDIVSIIFTATKDITAAYPAVAAREMGMTDIPLICCREMDVSGSLKGCIRILLHAQKKEPVKAFHVYLGNAKTLRPDLTSVPGAGEQISIAIDGPAGAGKSTIAKRLSSQLGIIYLDTGAMYRAVALKVYHAGINYENSQQVIKLLRDTDIKVEYRNGVQSVLLDGRDVTDKIRTPEISRGASKVAVIPEVRLKLVQLQRNIAKENSVVMDGRDIGTYVLPDANRKFFITASIEERARRRLVELQQKGVVENYDEILAEMQNRDKNDSGRSFAPLKMAEDAILIDTTGKSIEEVVNEIMMYL
jgi:cytidylate kinase